jgi:ubiquinone/menaquinone biosynthesis C-methylase UbiE
MATSDIIIRDTLWKYSLLIILVLLALYIVLGKKIKVFREKFFAGFFASFAACYNARTEDVKAKLFAPMNDQLSGVTDLRNRGLIRILEVGVGSGANLKYFPQQSRLVVVDPNIYFEQYFNENKDKFPDIFLEKFIQCTGENMQEVESESVDAVVTTLVLCSVEDIQQVLREVQRVLVPGGKFYYLEHVAAPPDTRLYKVQRLLTKFFWKHVLDCYLDRNTGDEILKAGFSKVDQKLIRVDSRNSKIMKLIEPHVVGVATK